MSWNIRYRKFSLPSLIHEETVLWLIPTLKNSHISISYDTVLVRINRTGVCLQQQKACSNWHISKQKVNILYQPNKTSIIYQPNQTSIIYQPNQTSTIYQPSKHHLPTNQNKYHLPTKQNKHHLPTKQNKHHLPTKQNNQVNTYTFKTQTKRELLVTSSLTDYVMLLSFVFSVLRIQMSYSYIQIGYSIYNVLGRPVCV